MFISGVVEADQFIAAGQKVTVFLGEVRVGVVSDGKVIGGHRGVQLFLQRSELVRGVVL